MSEDALVSVHAAWALALAGTWTIEVSNFPWKVGNGVSGGADSDWTDQTAGNWIQENPSSAVISTAGAGNTATGATVTAGGTNAGGFFAHLGNLGARRARLKFVCTVGGAVSWSGVYDAVLNRFAFHDPLADLAERDLHRRQELSRRRHQHHHQSSHRHVRRKAHGELPGR